MKNKKLLDDFYNALKETLYKKASEISESLIESNPDDYNPQEVDCGYYNNGVGYAFYGKEIEYNEERAFKDAVEEIADDFENLSQKYESCYQFFAEEEKLSKALADLIRTM